MSDLAASSMTRGRYEFGEFRISYVGSVHEKAIHIYAMDRSGIQSRNAFLSGPGPTALSLPLKTRRQ